MQLHTIYTEEGMFLSKHVYLSWREVQAEYADYKASVGPWDAQVVINFLTDEYSTICPSPEVQVDAFVRAPDDAVRITFSDG